MKNDNYLSSIWGFISPLAIFLMALFGLITDLASIFNERWGRLLLVIIFIISFGWLAIQFYKTIWRKYTRAIATINEINGHVTRFKNDLSNKRLSARINENWIANTLGVRRAKKHKIKPVSIKTVDGDENQFEIELNKGQEIGVTQNTRFDVFLKTRENKMLSLGSSQVSYADTGRAVLRLTYKPNWNLSHEELLRIGDISVHGNERRCPDELNKLIVKIIHEIHMFNDGLEN